MGLDFLVLFSFSEVETPSEEVGTILKKDEQSIYCVVLPSIIDDPSPGKACMLGPIIQKVTSRACFVASCGPFKVWGYTVAA